MIQGILRTLIWSTIAAMALGEGGLETVSNANNQFALEFYKTLAKNDGNIICSPLSAHAVLSMAYQGAAGDTQTAFENTLHVTDKNTIADGYSDLIKHYSDIENLKLAAANKLFLHNTLTLKQTFKKVLDEKFDSGLQLVDFLQAAEAADSINSFVANKTENKIKELFTKEDFDLPTFLVLVNTLYIKGQWFTSFPERLTRPDKFFINADETVDVQMMYTHNIFRVDRDNELKTTMLKMPFANRNVSMVVVVPDAIDGLADVEAKLTPEMLKEKITGMRHSLISLHLPKFRIEQTINLKPPLTEMGLQLIFDKENCDLSGMIEGQELVISKAVQKVYIDVNEKGCEAAAASGLRGSPRSLGTNLKVDRPFFFMIIEQHEENLNILFAGRMTNPNGA